MNFAMFKHLCCLNNFSPVQTWKKWNAWRLSKHFSFNFIFNTTKNGQFCMLVFLFFISCDISPIMSKIKENPICRPSLILKGRRKVLVKLVPKILNIRRLIIKKAFLTTMAFLANFNFLAIIFFNDRKLNELCSYFNKTFGN